MSCAALIFSAVICAELTMPFMYGKPEKIGVEALVVYTARWHAAKAAERGQPGIPESLALAIAETESRFRCDARGTAGEIGVMQIKATTAFQMGFAGDPKLLYDCETNIWYGVLYLQRNFEKCGGVVHCTISKYNRGMHARSHPVTRYTEQVKRTKKKSEQ